MKCPQCGADNPDDAWNCGSCRINLYWATQHYDDLARLRDDQGLASDPSSPTFLVAAHKQAMTEREQRGLPPDNKVRIVARKIMREGVIRRRQPRSPA